VDSALKLLRLLLVLVKLIVKLEVDGYINIVTVMVSSSTTTSTPWPTEFNSK